MGVIMCFRLCAVLCFLLAVDAENISVTAASDVKEEVDKVIEDEITMKLSTDLLQSIERKFFVDLEKSVNMVLMKIRLLLQNGTTHIQDKLLELQGQLDSIRKSKGSEVDTCLHDSENETTALAEKALHQMVVCGYALIGHDPAQAVSAVISMKDMIKTRMKSLDAQRPELNSLLKVCGHDHDSLKKVIKCVIAKSPIIKSTMMDVTSRLIQGVVDLTKIMAHGAMHEACLIEVIRTVEDESFEVVRKVRSCAFKNSTIDLTVSKYIEENNATVLDIPTKKSHKVKIDGNKKEVAEMKHLLRRMLGKSGKKINERFKMKLKYLQDFIADKTNSNEISDDVIMVANKTL